MPDTINLTPGLVAPEQYLATSLVELVAVVGFGVDHVTASREKALSPFGDADHVNARRGQHRCDKSYEFDPKRENRSSQQIVNHCSGSGYDAARKN